MDHFELSLLPPYHEVEIRINGAPLLETVRALEVPWIEAERAHSPNNDPEDFPEPGSYMYQTVRCLSDEPSAFGTPIEAMFILEPDDPQYGKVAVLYCDCGVDACWPLLARVDVLGDTVRWSEFSQFHRDWQYDLGPLCFSREQYDAEIRRVRIMSGETDSAR